MKKVGIVFLASFLAVFAVLLVVAVLLVIPFFGNHASSETSAAYTPHVTEPTDLQGVGISTSTSTTPTTSTRIPGLPTQFTNNVESTTTITSTSALTSDSKHTSTGAPSSTDSSVSVRTSTTKRTSATTSSSTGKATSATTSSNRPHSHSYTSNITASPNCTETGVKVFRCSCGHSYTEVVPARGHNWAEATCLDPKYCRNCNIKEGAALGHTGGTATCTSGAVCSRCRTTYTDKIAHNYSNGKCTMCSQADPSVPTFNMDKPPITKGGYKITHATTRVSGNTLYVTLSGERISSSLAYGVTITVFRNGFQGETGKKYERFPMVAVGSSFSLTIAVEGAIVPDCNRYNVWIT